MACRTHDDVRIHSQRCRLWLRPAHCQYVWLVITRLRPPPVPLGRNLPHRHSRLWLALSSFPEHSHFTHPQLSPCHCRLCHDLEVQLDASRAHTRCQLLYHRQIQGGRELDDLYQHGERCRRNKEECHGRCYFHPVLRREYCRTTTYQESDEGEILSGTVGRIDYLVGAVLSYQPGLLCFFYTTIIRMLIDIVIALPLP